MAELHLPLLAHTGGEFSLPTYRPDLCNPACLKPVLELGVTVIAAHCGAPALPWGRDFSPEFLDLRNSFPNLYGDVSALSLSSAFQNHKTNTGEPGTDPLWERLSGRDFGLLVPLSAMDIGRRSEPALEDS